MAATKLKSFMRLTARVLCSFSSSAGGMHGRASAAEPCMLGVSQQPKRWGALNSGRPRRYNSNEKHQHEVDDMAAAMEPVLFEFGADIVFAGHVHAYERSFRSYRHARCGALDDAAQHCNCHVTAMAHSMNSLQNACL